MKQRTLAMMTGFEQYTRKTRRAIFLAGCGKSLNRDDSPPQGLKPSLILHDLRGAKAPLYHSAAGFRDFFRSLLGVATVRSAVSSGRKISGWEVDRTVRAFITARGDAEYFIHSTGETIRPSSHV